MPNIKRLFENYSLTSTETTEVHDKPIFMGPQRHLNEVIGALHKDLHLELLYHLDVVSGPNTTNLTLKYYNTFTVFCTTVRRRSHGVVNMMYTVEED